MAYFVTGATGFIGRHLVEELLRNRTGDVYVLVRESSRDRLDALIRTWPDADRVHPVTGDLTADEERNDRLNVEGTRHAVDLANALDAGTVHHVSSVAVAGAHRGLFREDMFDEGQKLPSPYHRTKFESERIARDDTAGALRVYRPAVVVGHSQTGVMDKVDGPYYFFKALQKIRGWLPEWAP